MYHRGKLTKNYAYAYYAVFLNFNSFLKYKLLYIYIYCRFPFIQSWISIIQPSAVFSISVYIITDEPGGTIKKNSTGESAGKSKDNTGVIAGGITGAILFVIFVVVIVLHVQRKILKNQHDTSFRVNGRAVSNRACQKK